MADLVIRGMEMPKDWDLWLCIDTGGIVYNVKPVITGTAQEVGTAIPLPEGHGRLGDLDALQKEFKKSHDGKKLMLIDTAPTIVPADVTDNYVGSKSEGGTDDD